MTIENKIKEHIEREADNYTSTSYFHLEYSTSGTTAKECQKAFKAGAEMILPILLKVIEQRNLYLLGLPISKIERCNNELLQMLGSENE